MGGHHRDRGAQARDRNPGAEFTWSPAGLTIHIPEDLITMDMATELERVLRQLFTAREA